MQPRRYRHAAAGLVLSLLAAALLAGATQAPAFAPTTSAARQGARPTTAPTTQVSLHFQDVFFDAVLTELSRDYGFEIPIDEAPRDFRVSLISEKPIPPEEAISLLNIALKPKGYTAILSGRVLKVMDRSKVKRQNIPVNIGGDPDKIADNDDIITQVIPVRSLDAVKLRQDLTPLISSDADVASNAASNSLIITDSSSNIRRIVKIVCDLDQHQAAASDLKVVQLLHADAESAAKLVMTIFRPDLNQQSGQSQPGPPFFGGLRGGAFVFGGGPPGGGPGGFGGGPPGMGGGTASASSDQGATGKINAASDQRTNTVVVTGPPETVKVVIDMLHEIDNNPASQQTFFLSRLKNADASNLQGVLNSLFGTSSGTLSNSSNNSRTGTSKLSYVSTPSSGSGNRSSGGLGGGGGFGGGSFGGGGGGFTGGGGGFGGGGGGFGGGGGPSSSGQRGSSDIAGQVYVVADTYTNSLLVETATRFEQQVRQVIAELDRPVPQVLIKVLVAEVTHDNNADFGVDYSILNTRPNGLGQSYSQSFGAPTGGLVVGLIEDKINATLHALAQQNKLDVLSRPYILASDNQEAYVLIGQEVPIVTSNTTTALGQTVSNYNYQSVGVILDVIPHINPKGLVTLQVSPQISQLTAQTVTVGPGVSVPVIASRTAISQVAIKDGQTIVIGGLMQDQKTLTVNKVPILGDIPILKYAFSRTTVDKTKTELLIFLTPHVAPQPDLLKPMSKDELKGTRLTPNAVEPGTFDEHLRGMERGTAQP